MSSSQPKVALLAAQIAKWLSTLRPETATARWPNAPLVVGINGLQGSGKTTLTTSLLSVLRSPPYSLSVASLSTDDLYLIRADQVALASSNPSNPLLQYRGNPGTHDIELGVKTLRSIRESNAHALAQNPVYPIQTEIPLPSYDKSLHNGRGDRLPVSQWPKCPIPLDVLLFEGCYLGFKPLSPSTLSTLISSAASHASAKRQTIGPHHLSLYSPPALAQLNSNLAAYEAWHKEIDAFVHIVAEDPNWVYEWRWEQEETMRAKRGDPNVGLSREQVEDFVDRFVPMYVMCLPRLTESGFFANEDGTVPETGKGRHLKVVINRQREVVESSLL